MADKLKVKARNPEIKVPVEYGKDAQGKLSLIGDAPVEVPDTRYYRRRIAAGDLVEVKE